MDRIRLKVLGLSYSMSQAGAYALILADEQDMHRIPIVIGMPEAQSIAIQLEKILFILRLKLWKRPVLRSVRKQDRPNPPKKKRSCNNPIPFRN